MPDSQLVRLRDPVFHIEGLQRPHADAGMPHELEGNVLHRGVFELVEVVENPFYVL